MMLKKYVFILIAQFALLNSCIAKNNDPIMESDTSLHYIIRKSKSSKAKSPLLILLHGYGSNENDLFALANFVPDDWNVVSVRGSYQLAENSYRWYDVKMEHGKIAINIIQEEESRKKLLQLIAALTEKYGADTSKIVVAGFSQGANMAQSIGLGSPKIAAGFAVFSGRFVEEFIPFINNATELKNSKAFVSHGSSDNMLPITYAIENKQKLNELGIAVVYSEDAVAHSISIKQWKEFCNWLHNFN